MSCNTILACLFFKLVGTKYGKPKLIPIYGPK